MDTQQVTGPDHSLDNAFLKNTFELSHSFPKSFTFYDGAHELVGTLHFGPPMRFEGDCDASAKLFFEHVCRLANQS